MPAYALSKGAVAALTKALCDEWPSRVVNVNVVAPGHMATDYCTPPCSPTRCDWSSSRCASRGRALGQSEDSGNVVVFLASSLRAQPVPRGRRRLNGPLTTLQICRIPS